MKLSTFQRELLEHCNHAICMANGDVAITAKQLKETHGSWSVQLHRAMALIGTGREMLEEFLRDHPAPEPSVPLNAAGELVSGEPHEEV